MIIKVRKAPLSIKFTVIITVVEQPDMLLLAENCDPFIGHGVVTCNFIHQIVSSGYYGFRFVTPTPPQCVERFHRYRSNEKSIIASLLKFAGYIHNHKILPGNIFGLILKNKMAARNVYSTSSKEFCWPSKAKGIIGKDLKFAGYVSHYKILTGIIFGLFLRKKWPPWVFLC